MKTLFTNAYIIAYDTDINIIENGFLGVEDDKIIYISSDEPVEKYDCTKNYSGKLLIPGLINSHTHTAMVLLRGVGSDKKLQDWLDTVLPIEDKMTLEDIKVGSRVALMEMIASGTTSCADMYIEPAQMVSELCSAGIKGNITRAVLSFDENEGVNDSFRAKEFLQLYEQYNGYDNGRIKVDFGIHAEYTAKEKIVKEYSELCHKMGGRAHLHISETQKEHSDCIKRYGKTPTRWFYDNDLFNSPVSAAHCVCATDDDLDIFARNGASIVHNPSSNMKLGSGFAPIQKALEKGINVTIGTDGASSNNNLNLIEEMHLAALIHKGFLQDATAISPKEVFKMATVNGAVGQGRDDIGALAVGKKADIVAINLDKAHLIPHKDLLATLCYSVQGSDVVMTMSDGKVIYENGIYLTIDEEKALYELKNTVQKLIG